MKIKTVSGSSMHYLIPPLPKAAKKKKGLTAKEIREGFHRREESIKGRNK